MKIVIKLRENANTEEEMKSLASKYGLCNVYSVEDAKDISETLEKTNDILERIAKSLKGIAWNSGGN